MLWVSVSVCGHVLSVCVCAEGGRGMRDLEWTRVVFPVYCEVTDHVLRPPRDVSEASGMMSSLLLFGG